ncbi:hypothetical protein DITRI_Ditri02bG0061000 [Diplodiscus trichospermus]
MARKPHHDAETNAIDDKWRIDGTMTFKPRGFSIVWGNDSRYWRIPPRSQSNNNGHKKVEEVAEFAELVQVSWLEVRGVCKLEASTKYQISFQLSFKRNATGWSGCPVFLMAKVGFKGRYDWRKLKELEKEKKLPRQRTDVPSDTEPFVVEVRKREETPDTRLFFGLYEVWSGKRKRGLRVHGATIKRLQNPP